jgi:hypothetical protein
MRSVIASDIMSRTTLDIADPIMDDLRAIQKAEGRSIGSIASELLADALAMRRRRQIGDGPRLTWIARSMGGMRVDLEDKDALYEVLDRDDPTVQSARRRG